jgi:hypothetical protein
MDESVTITEHGSRMLLGILKAIEVQQTYLGDNMKIHFDPDLIRGLIEDIDAKRM